MLEKKKQFSLPLKIAWLPNWKNSHPLSEKLVTLGIMGVQLKAPIRPQFDRLLLYTGDFRGGGPHMMQRDVRLSDSYAYFP